MNGQTPTGVVASPEPEKTGATGTTQTTAVGHEDHGLAQDGTPARVMATGAAGGNGGPLDKVAHPLDPVRPQTDIELDEAGEFDKVREKLKEIWSDLKAKDGAGIATLKSKVLELDHFLATHLHLKYGRTAPPPTPAP